MYLEPPRPPAGPYRAVLFDVDGTLIDTAELIADSLEHACRVHLGRVHPREEYLALIGRPAMVQMQILGAEHAAEMFATAVAYYEEHAHRERPFPGALDALARLHEHGFRLALVTSKTRAELMPTLARYPLHPWVHAVVTADQTTRPKPWPDPVYLALQTLEVAAAEALFVGDSPYDVQAGRAAGVHTGAATWGPHRVEVLQAEAPRYLFRGFRGVLATCGIR